MLKPLAEQVLVITGSSSGIGRATAVEAALKAIAAPRRFDTARS